MRRAVVIAILLILVVSAGVRVWRLSYPSEYVFDEVYYAKDAKAIADNRVGPAKMAPWMPGDSVSWPHPDIGKFAIAAGIILLGDHAVGWRLPAVAAGMAILVCIYPLARRLALSRGWALVALLLAAADPLGITQSRIATLDIFVAAWSVLCVYFALRYVQDGRHWLWLLLCGLTGGLALSTKWSGGLALAAAVLIVAGGWLARHWQERRRRAADTAGPQAAGAAAGPADGDGAQDGTAPLAATAASPAGASAVALPVATPPAVTGADLSDAGATGRAGTPAETDPAPDAPGTPGWRPLSAGAAAETDPARHDWAAAPPTGTAEGAAPPAPPLPTPSAARTAAAALRAALPAVAALVLLPLAVYMASYTQYFLSGHSWADWRELQRQMWVFGIGLHAKHSYASIAPSWIIDYRPVWYYFNGTTEYRGIVAIGNPFLWWTATAALLAAPIIAVWRRTPVLLIPAALVAVLYLPWFATTRTSFLYYMTPVAPFLAVLVAAALAHYSGRQTFARRDWLIVAAVAVATAVLWNPVGRLAEWLFWQLPRQLHPALGWVGVGIGVVLALMVLLEGAAPRSRPRRPLYALVAVGLTVGIVACFLPVILALPISPEYFSRITWFPSWI